MTEVAAGIYCRISKADEGDFVKTDDQERICRDHAAWLGWPVAEVYTDHSKSAWQPNRKRPAWDRMLLDVKSGRINALIVFHGDRLIGRPEDLKTLLDLGRSRGILVKSPSGDRDLSNPDDEFVLWIEAAMKGRESANLSRRRKAQYERWRREGRVVSGGTGGRRYAFETDGLTIIGPDRCEIATRRVFGEAELLRDAAAKIVNGHSTGSVASWLNAQGATSVTGKPFTQVAVRRLLTRARYAGLMPDGITPAAWPAILDRGDWETICGILSARAARHTTGPARYLLSGLATCGACGQTLQAHRSGGGVAYACRHCWKVFRSMRLLDGYVTRMVWRRLNHPGNPVPDVPQLPGLAAEFATLTKARAELAERIVADPSQKHADLLLRRLDRLEERLAALRDQTGDTARLRLIRQHQGITMEQFLGLPLAVRRALVAAHFTVEVLPASHRGPGFNPRDVRMTPI